MRMENSLKFAREMDQNDPLAKYRNEFYIPQVNGKDSIYFTGNSLGLQPKSARAALEQEMKDWELLGVEGHFDGKNPWFHYHKFLTEKTATLVGAKPIEVVVMNNLTVNLHLLMASFYRPTASRFRIIVEAGAFPSDQYAVESQARMNGFDPDEAIIDIAPREGETALRTEDIIATIKKHGESVALVMLSGVQYYTGQAFDIENITKAAHNVGAYAGWDLAHAAGNIPLKLSEWGVDFAAWCSYKYLNSGPGSVSGVFVAEKHGTNPEFPRYAGWWGHQESSRFQMKKGYIPEPGAAGWQLSNAPIFTMAVHNASLEMFEEVGMGALHKKAVGLNKFLEFCILEAVSSNPDLELDIITPKDRGCQISMISSANGKAVFDHLTKMGVIADWRQPNVIRIAAVPLYNTFEDAYGFGELLASFKE
jgi:kynureninase